MIRIENRCAGCELPCIGDGCPYYRVTCLYCDYCGTEENELYEVGDEQLCKFCLPELDEEEEDYPVITADCYD